MSAMGGKRTLALSCAHDFRLEDDGSVMKRIIAGVAVPADSDDPAHRLPQLAVNEGVERPHVHRLKALVGVRKIAAVINADSLRQNEDQCEPVFVTLTDTFEIGRPRQVLKRKSTFCRNRCASSSKRDATGRCLRPSKLGSRGCRLHGTNEQDGGREKEPHDCSIGEAAYVCNGSKAAVASLAATTGRKRAFA